MFHIKQLELVSSGGVKASPAGGGWPAWASTSPRVP